MRELSLSYSLRKTSDSSANRVLHLDINLQLTREPPQRAPARGPMALQPDGLPQPRRPGDGSQAPWGVALPHGPFLEAFTLRPPQGQPKPFPGTDLQRQWEPPL